MQRIMILGGPGSGKSTLARQLGTQTGLPVFHMDHIHYKAGWVDRPKAEKIEMAHAVEAQERWIFEGGLSATYNSRAARAEQLIWLDLPVGLRLWRVAKRLVRYYGQNRPDFAPGCHEYFGWHTVEFYAFIWRTRQSSRQRILRLIDEQGAGLAVTRLTSPAQVRAFCAGWGLEKQGAPGP
ncbi:DNA topology modulation protein FlaR [Alphaproteobacteria bacterium KMM 3653]|uniref:DNA topology modulation protein FlaR n=1 Tax=Harenicola maris TaxID=2841044 RepID=A0AAP2CME7_9RHOB|nr:DNA topology modulation protein FlaR [Harenicola maris]